ncbi:hypothetical protein [Nocardioides bruguierae]|uniref:YgjV family protein n=1 Tax=Nocardioides bruguierae TaxID=2945102 RepID=A0A9X2IGP7_9ACTN|nr:hypothetical protein [Nocardioides bruguierae]MCM0622582.1 hypothetical protein [Nocardioides bruguierae]
MIPLVSVPDGPLLEAFGWAGSALLVLSLTQQRVLRFRVLNLAAGLALLLYNLLIGVWPMVGLNAVTSAINVWFLVQLTRQRHDEASFAVLPVAGGDAYLRHVLDTHASDIRRYQPDFDPAAALDERDLAFVVQRGDETVGLVVLRRDGDVARLRLDHVTPRYRDFTPGEFVFRRSEVLRDLGFRHVMTPPQMVGAYYDHIGFRANGREFVLDLEPRG